MTNLVNPTTAYNNVNPTVQQDGANVQPLTFNQIVEENPVLKAMDITPDVLVKSALLVPPLVVTDKFVNSKLIGGAEDKTIIKKIADFGDKIYNSLGDKSAKISDFIKNNRLVKYFTSDYSAVPRNSLAKIVVYPEINVANELASKLKKLEGDSKYAHLFGNGKDSLSTVAQDFIKNVNPAEAAKESDKLLKVTDELISKGTENSSKLSQLRNKLKAADLKMGKTPLGSSLARNVLEAKQHLTFGGGVFGFAFVSFSLNRAFKEASEAPEGEKISTFMHVMSEEFLSFLLLQTAISPMYKICGNKYRGMTKEARKELENLIQRANSNPNITKEEINVAKLQRDLLIKGFDKNDVAKLAGKSLNEAQNLAKTFVNKADIKFFERPLKFMGKVLGAGLDEIQKTKFSIFGKKFKPTFVGTMGGLGRFAVIVGVITPMLQKPVDAVIHAIFGNPETYLKKQAEKENEGATQDNQQKETNLVKKWTNLPENVEMNQAQQNQQTTQVEAQTSQPQQNPNVPQQQPNQPLAASKLDNNNEESLYVPSIQVDNSYAIEQENEINNKVNELLKKSEESVNHYSKFLQDDDSGNATKF